MPKNIISKKFRQEEIVKLNKYLKYYNSKFNLVCSQWWGEKITLIKNLNSSMLSDFRTTPQNFKAAAVTRMQNNIFFPSQCQQSTRVSTWCQLWRDRLSDSARRSKSSCRCLRDDRPWWHESTGHTGDACRLCNVCKEESRFCDTIGNEDR